jgi:hypothetical protein
MIVLLSGAKKNIGDFIITDRARTLLERVLDDDVLWMPNWESLDGREEEIASARAVVVAGGPGYRPGMYGSVYKLFSDPETLPSLGVQVRFLGLGWKGEPGDDFDLLHYRFTPRTMGLVHSLGDRARFSARDPLSLKVLTRNGIDGVMTGCPVWYHLDSLGKPLKVPADVRRLVFTPPEQRVFHAQSRALLRGLREMLPSAEIVVAFHRGIEADEHTSAASGAALKEYASFARGLGCRVEDVSYDLARIAFYDDCDLHVGYRLHGHLYFLSKRRPSVLLEEDGRGRGATLALGAPGVRAWELTWSSRLARTLSSGPVARVLARRFPVKAARSAAVVKALEAVRDEIASGFERCSAVPARIDETWPLMQAFVKSM